MALVIGINVGTTFTACIAVIGGSVAAKRTAVAHVFFNLVTGMVAFAMLPIFAGLVARVGSRIGPGDATIFIATFHTVFNLLGVLLFLPFTPRFAALVERLVKDRGPRLTRHLDRSAGILRAVALEASRLTLFEIATVVARAYRSILAEGRLTRHHVNEVEAARVALDEVAGYLSERGAGLTRDAAYDRHVSTVRALERLESLVTSVVDHPRGDILGSEPLRAECRRIDEQMALISDWLADGTRSAPTEAWKSLVDEVAELRHDRRRELFELAAEGQISAVSATKRLDALRWLAESTVAWWRVTEHLKGERLRRPSDPVPVGDARPESGETRT